jgi:hypothetical protein
MARATMSSSVCQDATRGLRGSGRYSDTTAFGERTAVEVSRTVEEGAPPERYGAVTALSQESDIDDLETRLDDVRNADAFRVVEGTATPTGSPTSTPVDTATAAADPATPTPDPGRDRENGQTGAGALGDSGLTLVIGAGGGGAGMMRLSGG